MGFDRFIQRLPFSIIYYQKCYKETMVGRGGGEQGSIGSNQSQLQRGCLRAECSLEMEGWERGGRDLIEMAMSAVKSKGRQARQWLREQALGFDRLGFESRFCCLWLFWLWAPRDLSFLICKVGLELHPLTPRWMPLTETREREALSARRSN